MSELVDLPVMAGLRQKKKQGKKAKQAELFSGKVMRAQDISDVFTRADLFFMTGNTRRSATFVLEYHFCLSSQQRRRLCQANNAVTRRLTS